MPKLSGAARERRPTNVTLPVELVAEAKALNINLSQACESGLARSVAEARKARWREDNRDAIDTYNGMIEQDGLPLDEFRQF
ncbi:type II toxin-antitoxin system CcdA family antitoxin [Microvirga sp. Mcv34]|uniref:type II toxin-antitoxin system CcdA family antitoxin n=1 Tax=Microvirga sp. Mcv34 TaxID=2926016 RepID=UPI0021C5E950|nr:type II toxin-antitoxin system CcdA family antitoxin [Microvirga sp. Mcv34]